MGALGLHNPPMAVLSKGLAGDVLPGRDPQASGSDGVGGKGVPSHRGLPLQRGISQWPGRYSDKPGIPIPQ
jgi:hypothetical protein